MKKIWFRLLISLIVGSILSETYHLKTGNAAIQTSNAIVFIGTILTFLILSLVVLIYRYRGYYFPMEKDETAKENILDDLS